MPRAYIGVGSNIEPRVHIPEALRRLAAIAEVCAVSTFYRTPPLGGQGPAFVNGVVGIGTAIPPLDLKRRTLRGIEAALGRVRTADPNAPRTIDLDLLLYDGILASREDLVLPDPHIEQRPFLAFPLLEIAPNLRLPGTGHAIRDVARQLDPAAMTALPALTGALRGELVGRHPRWLVPSLRTEDLDEPR